MAFVLTSITTYMIRWIFDQCMEILIHYMHRSIDDFLRDEVRHRFSTIDHNLDSIRTELRNMTSMVEECDQHQQSSIQELKTCLHSFVNNKRHFWSHETTPPSSLTSGEVLNFNDSLLSPPFHSNSTEIDYGNMMENNKTSKRQQQQPESSKLLERDWNCSSSNQLTINGDCLIGTSSIAQPLSLAPPPPPPPPPMPNFIYHKLNLRINRHISKSLASDSTSIDKKLVPSLSEIMEGRRRLKKANHQIMGS